MKRKIPPAKDRIEVVLEFCAPYLETMWAASIVGQLLDCDFRDSKEELEKYFKKVQRKGAKCKRK